MVIDIMFLPWQPKDAPNDYHLSFPANSTLTYLTGPDYPHSKWCVPSYQKKLMFCTEILSCEITLSPLQWWILWLAYLFVCVIFCLSCGHFVKVHRANKGEGVLKTKLTWFFVRVHSIEIYKLQSISSTNFLLVRPSVRGHLSPSEFA